MNRSTRAAATATAILSAVALAPAASASQPARESFEQHTDEVFTDWCPFPMRLQEDLRVTTLTFTNDPGRVVRETDVVPLGRGVLTNQDTGRQVTLNYPGGLHIIYYGDGSHTTRGTGPTNIAPPVPSPSTGGEQPRRSSASHSWRHDGPRS